MKKIILVFISLITVFLNSAFCAEDNTKETEEMIKLKTQVWARELNRQYRYLEATANRFQVQIQKAVARVESGDAGNGDTYSSYSSSDSMASAEKFDSKQITRCNGDILSKAKCLNERLEYIAQYINGNKTQSTVKKSLESLYSSISKLVGTKLNSNIKSCKAINKNPDDCFEELQNTLGQYIFDTENKQNKEGKE